VSRERLPDRRPVERHKLVVGGQTLYVDVGRYPDGRLGEVFVTMSRAGTGMRGMLDAVARLASVALQHGVPVESVTNAMRGLDFAPQGIVSGHADVTVAVSVLDALAQLLSAPPPPSP